MSPVLPESPKKPTGFAQKSGHPLGPQYRLWPDLRNLRKSGHGQPWIDMPPHMIVRLKTPNTYFKGTVSPPKWKRDFL
jgi:hypothetical protein